MAEWRPLHQQLSLRGGLETGGQAFDPPLLPYEKSLIEAIGCTEEEYKTLVRHAMLRQRVRPAEYDHIPDVVNEPTTAVIVNIVVGLLLTAASVLLAPKPPSFEESKKITGKKLADQVGPSRFNQSTSFDNAPSLAELNTPIPIPFGKLGFAKDQEVDVRTGGLSLVPALVWSRVYAYGAYQAFEGVYVVGEAGLRRPNLDGILLGTSALSALGERDYAFYWSSESGSNRPKQLLYGTEGTTDSGTVGREVFKVPAGNEERTDNFSMSYVPSGDTTFGTSAPIHNGTVYKFNWEVVSAPVSALQGQDIAKRETRARRRKIAGTGADFLHDIENAPAFIGMPGEGRAYSRRMGFIYVDGTEYSTKRDISVSVGSTAVFQIYRDDYTWGDLERTPFQGGSGFGGTEVNLEDLRNSADGWRRRASDLLTIGSRWICGACVWVVQGRLDTANSTNVTLECVSTLGDDRNILGVPGTDTIRQALGGYEGQDSLKNEDKFVDNSYFNLCRLHVATIRPIRRDAESIEIGIRSQVWNKASGLCNFREIPSPERLYALDVQNMNLTTGRMDKYFLRSSCFNVWVRPVAGLDQAQNEFKKIKQLFCVQGSAPITQNNYLRIRPKSPGYYEYRLIPRTGSDIAAEATGTANVIVLQSSKGVPYTGDAHEIKTTAGSTYGDFEFTTQGKNEVLDNILHNFEFYTAPPADSSITSTGTETVRVLGGIRLDSHAIDRGTERVREHAFLTHWLGDPRFSKNNHRSIDFLVTHVPGKTIKVRISATSEPAPQGTERPTHVKAATGKWMWTKAGFDFVEATGDWYEGEEFNITINVNGNPNVNYYPSNPASFNATQTNGHYNVYALYDNEFDQKNNGQQGYSVITYFFSTTFKETTVQTETVAALDFSGGGERRMELNSQIADCSYYEQVQKSNDSGPEHSVSYVNEYIKNDSPAEYEDMSTVGFTVKSSGEISNIEQLRLSAYYGIEVVPLRFSLRNIRNIGAKRASNLFAELVYYLLTNKTQGVGSVVPSELIDETSLETTADFLEFNKIFFDGVIEDSESIRGFLYDTAPLQLCTFTIKNGRFGMQPAVPFVKTIIKDADENVTAIVGSRINDDTPLDIDQIFTAGNIIEDTLQVQYIDISQRSNIRAVVTWRVNENYDLPRQASALLYWADLDDANTTEQSFDLSEFCTNREQALKTARFLMSTRRRVTKTISFKTTPEQLAIEPGSYIRVITEASVYDASSNGVILEAGQIAGFADVEPGTYDALLYGSASQEVIEAEIEITENESGFPVVEDERFHGYLFSLLTRKTDYSAYQIDSLNLEEDGLVSITAVEVPTDENGHSIVAKDVLDKSNNIFRVIE